MILQSLLSATLAAAPAAMSGSGGVGLPAGMSWKPFIDPAFTHLSTMQAWWLLLPLALGIAVVYKAVRVPEIPARPGERGSAAARWWSLYWRQVGVLTVQIIVSMLALAAAMYLLVEVYVGWIAEHAN